MRIDEIDDADDTCTTAYCILHANAICKSVAIARCMHMHIYYLHIENAGGAYCIVVGAAAVASTTTNADCTYAFFGYKFLVVRNTHTYAHSFRCMSPSSMTTCGQNDDKTYVRFINVYQSTIIFTCAWSATRGICANFFFLSKNEIMTEMHRYWSSSNKQMKWNAENCSTTGFFFVFFFWRPAVSVSFIFQYFAPWPNQFRFNYVIKMEIDGKKWNDDFCKMRAPPMCIFFLFSFSSMSPEKFEEK